VKEETIRKFGKLSFIDYLDDGNKARISRDFFNQLSSQIVKVMGQYYDGTSKHYGGEGVFPFYQSEKQSPSYIMPALFSVTGGAADIETVVSRKRKKGDFGGSGIEHTKKDAGGYLDYWAAFRKTIFAIEVKHAFFSVRSNNPGQEVNFPKKIHDRWNNSRDQLKKLKTDEFVEDSEPLVRLSFLVLPFYKTTTKSNSGSDCNWSEKALENFAEQCNFTLKDNPNLFAFWKLKKEQSEVVFADEKKETYPIVAFIARADAVK